MTSPPSPATRLAIFRIVLFYAVGAGLWILLSDELLLWMSGETGTYQFVHTFKGLVFVALTSLLLWFVLWRFAMTTGEGATKARSVGTAAFGFAVDDGSLAKRSASQRRALSIGLGIFLLVIVLLVGAAMWFNWQHHLRDEIDNLRAVGQLKARQIEDWLEERRRDALLIHRAPIFGEALPLWRAQADAALGAQLRARLEDYRVALRYESIAISDAAGEPLLQTGPRAHMHGEQLRAAIRQALAVGEVVMTPLFRADQPLPPHVHLDFAIPLPVAPGQQVADAAIVLRTDVEATLFALLRSWPVPSRSAETLLVRREDDRVLFLNELRHERDSALRLRIPASERHVLAVQALFGEVPPGSLIEGIDYRGVPALGIAYPVAGTDWRVVAKIDADELYVEARKDGLFIAAGGLLLWLMAVALALLLSQRRELQLAEERQAALDERAHTLGLLAAIADGSTDAIFAKDRAGRYLLFNRAASACTGRRAEEVLGRDDHALFPSALADRLQANDRQVMDNNRTWEFEQTLETIHGPRVFLVTKGPLHDAQGKVIGLFGIARDITGRAQAEQLLRAQNDELQRFNRIMIGRELDMIAMKRQINALSGELGRPPPYDLTRIDAVGQTATGSVPAQPAS